MGIQPLNWDKASPVLQAVNFSLWDLMEALKVSPYWTVFYLALRFMERTSADSPADQRIISAKHGEEVILPCRPAEKKDVLVVEWNRTDLESDQFVLLYKSKQLDPDAQSPSFKTRVDLKDVKNGDVSLVLKNVTTDDTGIYECRVQRENNRRKRSIQDTDPISIIVLIVQGQRIISAEPGEEVILPCRPAEKKDVLVVEWIRTDLGSDQYVLLYKDKQFDPEVQSPSFKNRVNLKDVKNGDVSLVLKNVTTDDTGRYECRVQRENNLETDLIRIIGLMVQPDQRIITAEPGEEVILPCRPAENKDVLVVKWSRTDLESDQYVVLYRNKTFSDEVQSPSFKNRVNLKDVKNGDVSLVLKKVTTDDTGIYECRVVQRGNNRSKRSNLKTDPISIIDLIVQGNEDGGNKDGRNQTGLIVGLSVVGVVLVVGAVLMLHRKQIRSSLKSNPPPAEEAEDENMVTGP